MAAAICLGMPWTVARAAAPDAEVLTDPAAEARAAASSEPAPEPGAAAGAEPATESGAEASPEPAARPDPGLKKFGIRFVPPDGWRRIKVATHAKAVDYLHPSRQGLLTVFYPKPIDEPALEKTIARLKELKQVLLEESMPIDGVTCRVTTIRQRRKSSSGNRTRPTTYRDYLCIRDSQLYRIRYAAPSYQFKRYMPIVEAAIATYDVKERDAIAEAIPE